MGSTEHMPLLSIGVLIILKNVEMTRNHSSGYELKSKRIIILMTTVGYTKKAMY